jgi:hypothetical protein
MLRTFSLVALGLGALALLTIAGCRQAADNAPQPNKDNAEAKSPSSGTEEHGHKPGQHGGNIVEIGRDNYHAEVVFAAKGMVRLYMLAKDESKVQEVEFQTLTAYARLEGSSESVSFELAAAPTKEDAAGKTSQFVGTLPRDLWGKQVEVTVPSIRIAGDRFRFFFKSPSRHAAMPAAVPTAKARQLYLTPRGKYTEADIKANGNQTARQKYGDEMAEHDAKPKKGDKICPISQTKANPKFTWIVGGKSYQFCCPPCIDEFVKAAKERPEQIKGPSEYVQP